MVTGDNTSQSDAEQALRGVDLSRLPRESGWMVIASEITTALPVAARMLYYPCQEEIDMGGIDPTVVPIEELIRQHRQVATLHPDDQALVDACMVDFHGTPETSTPGQRDAATVTPDEPMDENGKDRVLKVLRDAHPDGLAWNDIAERTGLKRAMTYRWLARLKDEDLATSTDDGTWRAA